ncbi:polyphenol oxidase I, chloroplastic-like [Aristolochia californica]|uniref:polyphenol oxidase I, chloroplastic-like n=1 Tax=Aristolochia californica TaxID=171875 RepID=UPI0035D87767
MGAKLWSATFFFLVALAFFSAHVLVQQSQDPSPKLRNTSLPAFSSTLPWVKSALVRIFADTTFTAGEETNEHRHAPLAADLSTCHRSLTDADVPVYCCPPNRESDEPVVDFQFPSPSEPKRIRRPAHLVDEDYIAKYEKAIKIMKKFPYEDPLNFMRQADMHCIYCTGAYNQLNSSYFYKIHRSWLFFPWHRIHIYFHERIVQKLIGDDNFALPYWNWDHPAGMVIPSFYTSGAYVDKDRDRLHDPPEIVDDSFDYVEKGLGPEEQIASNLAFMYTQMVSGAKKTELFMGCKRYPGEEGECDGPGTIELAPHNALHTWVGSGLQPERENMGAFYSAARDPIFYAHHANIDRLWTVWKQLKGHEPEFVDPVWLDSYFYFHDENRQLVRIKIRDSLDIDKLRYGYDEAELPWLNARPKPSVPPKLARHILMMRETKNGLQLPSQSASTPYYGPEGRILDTTIRVKVGRPKRHRSEKEKKEEEEILVVYGIDVKKDVYVKFDVLVNAVDENGTGPESREFAGTFVNARHGVRIVKREGDSTKKTKATLKLGISELLEDLEADDEESIWVSLVPKGGTGVHVAVEGVRIDYMP